MELTRCPNCHRELADPVVTACPHCGADLERLRALMERPEVKERVKPGYLPSDEDKARWDRRGRWGVGIVGGLLALWIIYTLYWPKYLPPRNLPRMEVSAEVEDRCSHRPRCLVVYLGAWCKACVAAVPTIKAINERLRASEEVGFQVVLAVEQVDDLKRMNRLLGPDLPCYVDKEGGFGRQMRRAGFSSVPSFFLADEDDKILKHVEGAYELDTILRMVDIEDP